MKILIVDDEELARSRLLRMLNKLGYNELVQASSAQEALNVLRSSHFDIVFLDINMPQTSGIELAYELRYLDEDIAIVFQTAYEEHALKAFDIGAVGYLVKPYSIEQLKQTISRIRAKQTNSQELHIMSKLGNNYLLLKPEDIHYIKADLSEVMIRSSKGFSYYAQKISDLEKKLEAFNFVKIHRSYLINIDEIKEIETIQQSKLRFTFKNNSDEIESSKDGAKAFRERFGV